MQTMFDILDRRKATFYSYSQYLSQKSLSKRDSAKYREWREKVLSLYNRRCHDCQSSNNLHVHHIKEYADNVWVRVKTLNGVVLCADCHSKRHPWMNKAKPVYILRKKTESLVNGCASDPRGSIEPCIPQEVMA